jgi:hypothetical protein
VQGWRLRDDGHDHMWRRRLSRPRLHRLRGINRKAGRREAENLGPSLSASRLPVFL